MGTGSIVQINAEISGSFRIDYGDDNFMKEVEKFKAELSSLCHSYNLDLSIEGTSE